MKQGDSGSTQTTLSRLSGIAWSKPGAPCRWRISWPIRISHLKRSTREFFMSYHESQISNLSVNPFQKICPEARRLVAHTLKKVIAMVCVGSVMNFGCPGTFFVRSWESGPVIASDSLHFHKLDVLILIISLLFVPHHQYLPHRDCVSSQFCNEHSSETLKSTTVQQMLDSKLWIQPQIGDLTLMLWQKNSRVGHFRCEIRIRHEILHRHGAPGFDQAFPDRVVCVDLESLFHSQVFYIFWEKTTPMGPLQGHLKSWRKVGFSWFFFLIILKTPALAYERGCSILGDLHHIEQASNRFCGEKM